MRNLEIVLELFSSTVEKFRNLQPASVRLECLQAFEDLAEMEVAESAQF